MARVIELADLKRSETAALFAGAKHGDGIAASFFVTAYPHGRGPDLHLHPARARCAS